MTPLHDHEAEQSVLGSLMLDPRAIDTVRDLLSAEEFGEERHGHIYRAALALSERGEPIEIRALARELGIMLPRSGGIDYLAELPMATPAATSVRHYAQAVVDLAARRRLGQVGQDIAAMSTAEAPTEDLIASAEAAVLGVMRDRAVRSDVSLGDSLREVWGELEAQLGRRQFVTGVTSGFRSIDRMTQGWQRQELVILAARPSVGKTSLALGLARRACEEGKSVCFASLEMSRSSLTQRVLFEKACVDSWMVKTGRADAGTFQKIARGMDALMGLPLLIDDTPGMTVSTLRHRARRWVSEKRCDLLIVDYLQLMHGRRQESRVQEVSDISTGLKEIAKELNIPVIALSQLSRDSEKRPNRRPQLSDLRDSGTIEQDADIVMFLYREGMHNPDVDARQTKLIVAKNRNGPVGDLDLVFIPEQTAFEEPVVRQDDRY